jgi:hypothetical protein
LVNAGEQDSSSGSESEPSFDNLEIKALKKVVPLVRPEKPSKRLAKRKLLKSGSSKGALLKRASTLAEDGLRRPPISETPPPTSQPRPEE